MQAKGKEAFELLSVVCKGTKTISKGENFTCFKDVECTFVKRSADASVVAHTNDGARVVSMLAIGFGVGSADDVGHF